MVKRVKERKSEKKGIDVGSEAHVDQNQKWTEKQVRARPHHLLGPNRAVQSARALVR